MTLCFIDTDTQGPCSEGAGEQEEQRGLWGPEKRKENKGLRKWATSPKESHLGGHMFRSAMLSSHVVWGPGSGARGTWMRGHSSAPRGLLACSPGGSQWGELASLLVWLGGKAWGGAT